METIDTIAQATAKVEAAKANVDAKRADFAKASGRFFDSPVPFYATLVDEACLALRTAVSDLDEAKNELTDARLAETHVLNLDVELANVLQSIDHLGADLAENLETISTMPMGSGGDVAMAKENATALAFWLGELGKLQTVQGERAEDIPEASPELESEVDDWERCNDCGAIALSPECCKSATVTVSRPAGCSCRPADGGHSAHSFALMMMAEMVDGDHLGDVVVYNGQRATLLIATLSGPFFSMLVEADGQTTLWRPSPSQTTVARRSMEWHLTTLEEPCPCGWS